MPLVPVVVCNSILPHRVRITSVLPYIHLIRFVVAVDHGSDDTYCWGFG